MYRCPQVSLRETDCRSLQALIVCGFLFLAAGAFFWSQDRWVITDEVIAESKWGAPGHTTDARARTAPARRAHLPATHQVTLPRTDARVPRRHSEPLPTGPTASPRAVPAHQPIFPSRLINTPTHDPEPADPAASNSASALNPVLAADSSSASAPASASGTASDSAATCSGSSHSSGHEQEPDPEEEQEARAAGTRGVSRAGDPRYAWQLLRKLQGGQRVVLASMHLALPCGVHSPASYPRRVRTWLTGRFPGAAVEVVSTGAEGPAEDLDYLAQCYAAYVPPDADLVFLEYPRMPPDHCRYPDEHMQPMPAILAFEQLMRHLISLPTSPLLVLVAAWHPEGADDRFDDSCEDHLNILAKYYALPVVSLRNAVWHAARPSAPPSRARPCPRRLPWDALVPPQGRQLTRQGHAVLAGALTAYLGGALSVAPKQGQGNRTSPVPPPLWEGLPPNRRPRPPPPDAARPRHQTVCAGPLQAPPAPAPAPPLPPPPPPSPLYFDIPRPHPADPAFSPGLAGRASEVARGLEEDAAGEGGGRGRAGVRYTLSEAALQRGVAHLGDPRRLQHALARARRGQPITLAALGGSVTHAGGAGFDGHAYHSVIEEWFRARFPSGGPLRRHNGAVGASNVQYMNLCLRWHVPAEADVVFVEYAVNEDRHPRLRDAHTFLSMERLLRKLLVLPHAPAVILVHMFWFAKGEHRLGSGLSYFDVTPEDQYDTLAAYYGLPAFSLRDAAYHLVKARHPGFGLDEVLEDCEDNSAAGDARPDGCMHPNARGHHILAELIAHYLDSVFASLPEEALLVAAQQPPAEPCYDGTDTALLPAPLFAGNPFQPPASRCYRERELEGLVGGRNTGWDYVVEFAGTKKPKPGLVARTSGAQVDLVLDTRALRCNKQARRGMDGKMHVALGFLVTYDHIGSAAVTCLDCHCETKPGEGVWAGQVAEGWVMEGLYHERHSSIGETFLFAEPKEQCTLRLTNLNATQTGDTKFKLTNVVIGECPGYISSGFFAKAEDHGIFVAS